MIIFKITDGLGNQLFQWAYGYSLARKFNTKVYYDISHYHSEQFLNTQSANRNFSLPNLINENIPLLTQEALNEFQSKPQYIIQDNFNFNHFDYSDNYSYYFSGYWQSENYFKDYRDDILSLIDFNIVTPDNFDKSTSIHIRRGDYLQQQEIHPVCSIDYYKKAINFLGKEGVFNVFSDDIEWCKDNLLFENLNFIDGNSDIYDLKLMSLSSNNIIANSTFSWWSAWLNQNKDKKIVAPENWFGFSVNHPIDDLVPKSWILF